MEACTPKGREREFGPTKPDACVPSIRMTISSRKEKRNKAAFGSGKTQSEKVSTSSEHKRAHTRKIGLVPYVHVYVCFFQQKGQTLETPRFWTATFVQQSGGRSGAGDDWIFGNPGDRHDRIVPIFERRGTRV